MHPMCLGEVSGVIWTTYCGMHVVMSLLSVGLVCLSVCLPVFVLCCWYVCYYCQLQYAIVLIPVMVGWGDSMDGLLFFWPLRMDVWKL